MFGSVDKGTGFNLSLDEWLVCFSSGDKGTGFNLSLDEWLVCLAL